MDIKYIISIYLRAQVTESGPPLGTVLGNLGINAVKFCKEFNEFTADLPTYFFLKVIIFIYEDRSYSFLTYLPSTGYIISLLKFERKVKLYGKEITQNCILLKSVIQLAMLKFPGVNLRNSIPVVIDL